MMKTIAPATSNIPAEIGIAAVLSELFLVSVTVVVSTVWDPVIVVIRSQRAGCRNRAKMVVGANGLTDANWTVLFIFLPLYPLI